MADAHEHPRFAHANTGPGTYGEPDKLSRYLDPDHERALTARADATTRYHVRRQADWQRRRAVGCNVDRTAGSSFLQARRCGCVYCDPALHLATATQPPGGWVEPARCLCGAPAGCSEHAELAVVVFDDDPVALRDLQTPADVPPAGETP